ncbi:hypothetical protein F4777DRAFT_566894 [Nemania sp. FL0916]|nr:hypothetical protein F4777DRAFT_566894 [Nemania sp. FL0916]
MAFKLVLPQCGQTPGCVNHPPEPDKPLRIQIMGLLNDIDNLFDDGMKMPRPKHTEKLAADNFIEPGLRLARIGFGLLYGRDVDPGNSSDMVPRHQYDVWRVATPDRVILPEPIHEAYAITFDHLLGPEHEDDPETLMLNIVDPNDDAEAKFITIDKSLYTSETEPVLLLVPRCCQVRKGTTDRRRINREIREAKLPPEVLRQVLEEEYQANQEKQLRKRQARALADAVAQGEAKV